MKMCVFCSDGQTCIGTLLMCRSSLFDLSAIDRKKVERDYFAEMELAA